MILGFSLNGEPPNPRKYEVIPNMLDEAKWAFLGGLIFWLHPLLNHTMWTLWMVKINRGCRVLTGCLPAALMGRLRLSRSL